MSLSKHFASTTVPRELQEDPEGIIVANKEFIHCSLFVIEPELTGVKRGAVCSKKLDFHLVRAHMEAPDEGISMTIESLIMSMWARGPMSSLKSEHI